MTCLYFTHFSNQRYENCLKCESTKKWKCSNCQHLKSNNFGMLLHRIDTNDALKDIWVENYFSTTRFNDAACQMLFLSSSNAFSLQRTLFICRLKTKTFTTKEKIIKFPSDHFSTTLHCKKFLLNQPTS